MELSSVSRSFHDAGIVQRAVNKNRKLSKSHRLPYRRLALPRVPSSEDRTSEPRKESHTSTPLPPPGLVSSASVFSSGSTANSTFVDLQLASDLQNCRLASQSIGLVQAVHSGSRMRKSLLRISPAEPSVSLEQKDSLHMAVPLPARTPLARPTASGSMAQSFADPSFSSRVSTSTSSGRNRTSQEHALDPPTPPSPSYPKTEIRSSADVSPKIDLGDSIQRSTSSSLSHGSQKSLAGNVESSISSGGESAISSAPLEDSESRRSFPRRKPPTATLDSTSNGPCVTPDFEEILPRRRSSLPISVQHYIFQDPISGRKSSLGIAEPERDHVAELISEQFDAALRNSEHYLDKRYYRALFSVLRQFSDLKIYHYENFKKYKGTRRVEEPVAVGDTLWNVLRVNVRLYDLSSLRMTIREALLPLRKHTISSPFVAASFYGGFVNLELFPAVRELYSAYALDYRRLRNDMDSDEPKRFASSGDLGKQARRLINEHSEVVILRELVHGLPVHAYFRTNVFDRPYYDIMFASIMLGLAQLHSRNVLHNDLTSSAVWIDSYMFMFKLTGSRHWSHTAEHPQLRLYTERLYEAPERSHGVFNYKSDIYSLGILMCELAIGVERVEDLLLHGRRINIRVREKSSPRLILRDALKIQSTLLNELPPSHEVFKPLLASMINSNPELRPNWKKLVAHPLFAGVNWTKLSLRQAQLTSIRQRQKKLYGFDFEDTWDGRGTPSCRVAVSARKTVGIEVPTVQVLFDRIATDIWPFF